MKNKNAKPDSGILIEATGAAGRWRVRVIRAGLSGNRNYYPDAVLREAAPLFEGARVFVKSDAEHLAGQGKDVRNLIGRISRPEFAAGAGPDSGEITADQELIEAEGDIARKLTEAAERDMTGLFGLSIDAAGAVRPGRIDGKPARIATAISAVKSVDLIVEPGAGGQFLNLIESKEQETMEYLNASQVRDIVEASNLPKAAKARLAKDYGEPSQVTEEELREAIKEEADYLAQFSESGAVRGLDGDDNRPRVELIEDRDSKAAQMLDAFFDPSHRDHRQARSIRECYREITGDSCFTGMLRECDQARLRESLGSANWASVLGDSVARRVVALYNTGDIYDVWRQLANIVPVNDFRTQERTRFGGYGDLPIVAESAAYLAVTSPTDEKATYAIAKRGGTEDVTLEMIANDDVGAVR